jgi:hypothetical protein
MTVFTAVAFWLLLIVLNRPFSCCFYDVAMNLTAQHDSVCAILLRNVSFQYPDVLNYG